MNFDLNFVLGKFALPIWVACHLLISMAAAAAPEFGQSALLPGTILVCDPFCENTYPAILSVDPRRGTQTILSHHQLLQDPSAIAIDSAGQLWVTDCPPDLRGAILHIDPVTGLQTMVTQGQYLTEPSGIVLDGQGSAYITDPRGVNGRAALIRVTLSDGRQTPIASGNFLRLPTGLAWAPSGKLVLTDSGMNFLGKTAGVLQIDPQTGEQIPLFAGAPLIFPHGLVMTLGGQLLVVDESAFPPVHPWGSSTFEAYDGDGPGGVLTLGGSGPNLSMFALSQGNPFVDPCGIALEADGQVLIIDCNSFEDRGGLFRINLGTHERTIVSARGLFGDPSGVAVAPAREKSELDSDGDGVPDSRDRYPNTPAGAVVDANGGCLDQLCPCDHRATGRAWRSHGDFVRHFHQAALHFYKSGRITKAQKNELVRAALRNTCGQRR